MDFATYVSPVSTAVSFATRQRRLLGGATAGSPADLSNLVLWLDASDSSTLYSNAGKTVNTAAGGDVYVWADKSGQGNDVSQAATGKYPLRQVGVQNGQDVVRLDGTDDFLQGALANVLTQPFTVWLVAKLTITGISNYVAIDSDDTSNRMLIREKNNWSMNAGAEVSGGTPDTSWHLFRADYNGADSVLWVDGVPVASGNAGSDTPDGITIGANANGSSNWPGDMALVVVQNGAATSDDVAIMNSYASSYWGITV